MAAVMDVNVCVDRDVKEQSEALYGELGIDLTTAINVFLRQSLPLVVFRLRFAWTLRIRRLLLRWWKRSIS